MERAAFDSMAAAEEKHWWFTARRTIIGRLIELYGNLPSSPVILEAGCGSGGNLDLLSRFGVVSAFELDNSARAMATARASAKVEAGSLPDNIGFGDQQFHLIALLDVLEHIDGDVAVLRSLGARLAPGGRLIITVPAFPWLWSSHDEIHHHKRRYSLGDLRRAAEAAGLHVGKIGYFNFLLLPLAILVRIISRLTGKSRNEDRIPPPPLNQILETIFRSEAAMIGRVPFPAGLSLFAILASNPSSVDGN